MLIKKIIILAVFFSLPLSVFAENIQSIYMQAVKNNNALKVAKAQHSAANLHALSSLASYFPQVNIYGDISGAITNASLGAKNFASVSLVGEITQVLVNPSIWSNIALSTANSSALFYNEKYQSQILMRDLIDDYLTMLSTHQHVEVSMKKLHALKVLLTLARDRLKVGTGIKLDVQRAETEYSIAQADLSENISQYNQAIDMLNYVAGSHVKSIFDLQANTNLDLTKSPTNYLLPITGNFLLKSYQQQADVAYYQARVQSNDYFPTITLIGRYIIHRDNAHGNVFNPSGMVNPPALSGNYSSFYAGINFTWNFFTSGKTILQAIHDANIYASAQYSQLAYQRFLYAENLQYSNQLISVRKSMISLQDTVRYRGSVLEQVQSQYQAGTKTFSDINVAITDYYTAVSDYQDARYNYIRMQIMMLFTASKLTPTIMNKIDKLLDTKAIMLEHRNPMNVNIIDQ